MTATGEHTFYGQIVRATQIERQQQTKLQRSVRRIAVLFTAVAAGICILLAATHYMQGYGLLDAFVSAATLAVAAIPEELSVVLTLFLDLGVYRLSQSKALVHRAVAVEDIGRVTCICSDKTGQ